VEAAALSICAQRCQSHYFSTTLHIKGSSHSLISKHVTRLR